MTTFRSPARRAGTVLAFVGAFALAGCGGSAPATAAPSAQAPTPAPATATAAPTETAAQAPSPTEAPTATPVETPTDAPASAATGDFGGFAFAPGEVLDYYVSQGFVCEDAKPSEAAANHTQVRCLKTEETGAVAIVALVVDASGVTADAFGGYITPAGTEGPDDQPAAIHLGGFVAAMLGTEVGAEAATWVATNLNGADLVKRFGDITAIIYQENDEGGVGHYVEVANEAFLNAPAP